MTKQFHRIIFNCALLMYLATAYSQKNEIDSLELALKTTSNDTIRLNLLFKIVDMITDDNIWPIYNEQAYKLAENLSKNKNELIQKKGKKGLADALGNRGLICTNKGETLKAIHYYEQSLKIQEEIGDKKGIANSYLNFASIAINQGDIRKALKYYEMGLRIQEEIGDKKGIGTSLANIGFIYKNQGDTAKAINYYENSLKIMEEIGDKNGIAATLNNMGVIYSNKNNIPKALECFLKSLKIHELIGEKKGISSALHNIGSLYYAKKDFQNALEYYKRSLVLDKEAGDKGGAAYSLTSIGMAYLKLKKHTLSHSYIDSALLLAKKLGFPEKIRNAEEAFALLESARGNYVGAFEHYKQFIIYRDSINNQETRKASVKSQLKYEYEKKEAIMMEHQEKERAVAGEKNRRQQIIIWSVGVGLFLVIVFATFVFRSLKTTRKQKIIIEEKQKEILDSIHYAKRIQQSLLPNEKFITRNLNRLLKKS